VETRVECVLRQPGLLLMPQRGRASFYRPGRRRWVWGSDHGGHAQLPAEAALTVSQGAWVKLENLMLW
jgi:hypothetical protein